MNSSDLGAVGGTFGHRTPKRVECYKQGSEKLGWSIASFAAPSTWFLINGGRANAAIPLR
jgi:hypothetical protein